MFFFCYPWSLCSLTFKDTSILHASVSSKCSACIEPAQILLYTLNHPEFLTTLANMFLPDMIYFQTPLTCTTEVESICFVDAVTRKKRAWTWSVSLQALFSTSKAGEWRYISLHNDDLWILCTTFLKIWVQSLIQNRLRHTANFACGGSRECLWGQRN